MKTLTELSDLDYRASKIVDELIATIIEETKDNPLELFTLEQIDEDEELRDSIYDLPPAYWIDKYEYYNPGVVRHVRGEEAEVFFISERWGETISLNLTDLPYYAVTGILGHIIERRQS